jgi:TPR repeat protein
MATRNRKVGVLLGVLVLWAAASRAGPLEHFEAGFDALLRGDPATAVQYFETAAAGGLPGAAAALGRLYLDGDVVPRDYASAVMWYRQAAERGHPFAQYELGALHYRGVGVEKDDARAAVWYLRSARQGYLAAQFDLAMMYWVGEGVPKNDIEAYRWFSLVATGEGDGHNQSALATIKADAASLRDLVAEDMTAADLATAKGLVRKWMPKPEEELVTAILDVTRPLASAAADFIVSTCYHDIDDVYRVAAYARLAKWQDLSGDDEGAGRPVDGDHQAWLVPHAGQQFIVSVGRGEIGGKPAHVCQVFANLPADAVVAAIARRVAIRIPTTNAIALENASIYELPEHRNVASAYMLVSRSTVPAGATIAFVAAQ